MRRIIFAAVCMLFILTGPAFAKDELRLAAAYMCGQINGAGLPGNRAVVFSASEGKIFCFNYFEPVPERAVVYHAWYHRDRLVTRRKLMLEPPSWKTYSTMQLRETDKGPWRVEILSSDNKRLDTVRFSVTD